MSTATPAQGQQLLHDLGIIDTPSMIAAAQAWLDQESGGYNNPLNLRAAGDVGWHTVPGAGQFGAYSSYAIGLQADANNLLSGAANHQFGYDKVVSAGKSGDAIGFLNALAASDWDAGHYGAPTTNNLIKQYDQITGQQADPSFVPPPADFSVKNPVNGACPTGWVMGQDIQNVLFQDFGALPIVGGLAGWLLGNHFDSNLCYNRAEVGTAFKQESSANPITQASSDITSVPGAIGDAAFTFGIIFVAAAVLIAGVLIMRNS